jgi:signal transduction protein with GAF and PtsI domain
MFVKCLGEKIIDSFLGVMIASFEKFLGVVLVVRLRVRPTRRAARSSQVAMYIIFILVRAPGRVVSDCSGC